MSDFEAHRVRAKGDAEWRVELWKHGARLGVCSSVRTRTDQAMGHSVKSEPEANTATSGRRDPAKHEKVLLTNERPKNGVAGNSQCQLVGTV